MSHLKIGVCRSLIKLLGFLSFIYFVICTKLFFQQMHLLLKHKILQFIFKISFLIWLLHVSVSSDHHQGAYDGTLLKLLSL